jgi:hypothetical protein
MMNLSVANNAERNQIVHHIAPELAPGFHMMYLQVLHRATLLAPPTVPLQHLRSKESEIFWI